MASNKLPLLFLGIPLTNERIDEIIKQILELVKDYQKDLCPRYVATVNSDFIANANSWKRGSLTPSELMLILRNAALCTIDGMPILWMCRLLGGDAKERVTGVDLLSKLAEALNQKHMSVFLLGGTEKTLRLCNLCLQAFYPDIVIVGSASPTIDIAGENLDLSLSHDDFLVEQINQSKPDVLLINLGNPKQEIWFNRVKHKLHVPVSIGLGGAFDLLTGMMPRAPVWMRHFGLEWLHRLMQEPGRLWKRYLTDIVKLAYMGIPLIVYHNLNKLIFKIFYEEKNSSIKFHGSLLFISSKHAVVLLRLPKRIDSSIVGEINQNLDDIFNQDALIFDFQNVRHIDLEGLAFLLQVSQRVEKENTKFFCLNIHEYLRSLLIFHRIWDCLADWACISPKEILFYLNTAGSPSSFYDAIRQDSQCVIISFFGKLDSSIDYAQYVKKIAPIIYQKECILDFTYCFYMDNTGLSFLLMLKKIAKSHYVSLKLTGLSKTIKKQLSSSKILPLFSVEGR
jgi:N-acetylglucosaminyldiphosphoundecaprenol N-acetyl-beta-D-mannosaminyltransferase